MVIWKLSSSTEICRTHSEKASSPQAGPVWNGARIYSGTEWTARSWTLTPDPDTSSRSLDGSREDDFCSLYCASHARRAFRGGVSTHACRDLPIDPSDVGDLGACADSISDDAKTRRMRKISWSCRSRNEISSGDELRVNFCNNNRRGTLNG